MLNPNDRSLYTAALTPPPGMVFDEAIATTFSLDPATLLTIPVHLALLGRGSRHEQTGDAITLLEALRRVMERVTVYAQRGRLQAPDRPHVLYALLEASVVEVMAPRGGSFHPKLWLLRFKDPTGESSPLLRLLVLSRNLTADRSWDLSLHLEGSPRGRYWAENRELGELLASLPGLAKDPMVSPGRRDQASRLADEVRRTPWEPPPGFERIRFHVLGLRRRPWSPPESNRMAVISPFCTDEALAKLCQNSKNPAILISRPDTLAELKGETRAKFQQCLHLDEAAETEDGEDQEADRGADTLGLHAKAYIFQRAWETHLFVGSANATTKAILTARNIEVLAELVGRRGKVGGIEKLLGPEGLGELLQEFQEADSHPVDELRQAAEAALERARRALAAATLRLHCTPAEEFDLWHLALVAQDPPPLEGIARVRAWPLSVTLDQAADLGDFFLKGGEKEIKLGAFSPQALTGLTAFELTSTIPDIRLRFALNLPVEGLPGERDAAIFRTVVRNREGFLRYLLLLLSGVEDPMSSSAFWLHKSHSSRGWRWSSYNYLPLLEELTLAFSREPEKLLEVKKIVRRLAEQKDGESVVPKDFLHLWNVFEVALEALHER
ncbi:MAG: phospholipase D family protein [Deltaproteobacteria bacterium]|nr:phospholipase D family protein [Deltaproteobacteria bacterium]